MKANELMISDWVAQKHSGLLLKVSEVRPPYIIADGEDGQFHEDTLEPIPLTPELLEQNGFEDNYYGDLGYAQSCGDVIGIHLVGESGVMDEMYFKYVHELQHALRLCGIYKEIVL